MSLQNKLDETTSFVEKLVSKRSTILNEVYDLTKRLQDLDREKKKVEEEIASFTKTREELTQEAQARQALLAKQRSARQMMEYVDRCKKFLETTRSHTAPTEKEPPLDESTDEEIISRAHKRHLCNLFQTADLGAEYNVLCPIFIPAEENFESFIEGRRDSADRIVLSDVLRCNEDDPSEAYGDFTPCSCHKRFAWVMEDTKELLSYRPGQLFTIDSKDLHHILYYTRIN